MVYGEISLTFLSDGRLIRIYFRCCRLGSYVLYEFYGIGTIGVLYDAVIGADELFFN